MVLFFSVSVKIGRRGGIGVRLWTICYFKKVFVYWKTP